MPSPIEALIDQNVFCVRCNLKPKECRCYKDCWCHVRYLAEEAVLHKISRNHQEALAKVRDTFPVGVTVENVCGTRAPQKAVVVGYSRFPYDNWLRVKYHNLMNVVREPSGYFSWEGK